MFVLCVIYHWDPMKKVWGVNPKLQLSLFCKSLFPPAAQTPSCQNPAQIQPRAAAWLWAHTTDPAGTPLRFPEIKPW